MEAVICFSMELLTALPTIRPLRFLKIIIKSIKFSEDEIDVARASPPAPNVFLRYSTDTTDIFKPTFITIAIDAIIVGDSKFMSPVISEISSISRHQATQLSDGQYRSTSSVGDSSSLIIVSPTDKIFTRFTDEYECEHIDGGPSGLPDYAICNKMCVVSEDGNKAIMLNLSVRKEYLSISDLEEWAFDHLV